MEEQKAVLIVDDNPHILELVKDTFSKSAYTVFGARSGKEALQIAEQEKIDVIIADITLTEQMNGYELCKRMKEKAETARIPVLMLSGRKDIDDKLKAVYAGADDYIAKPFSPEELAKRVRLNINLHF